jgi:hypothetical protein
MPMMTAQLVSMKSKFERVQNVAVVLHYFGHVTPSSMRAAQAILPYFASYKNSYAQARAARSTASAKDPKQVAAQRASSKTALYIEPYQPPLCSPLKISKHAIDGDFKQEWGLWSAYDAAATIGWATGSRGMDSIHVATAHIGLAEYFLTADKRQYQAATEAGLNSFLIES